MNILFVGKTDFSYNRTKVLIAGLSELEGVSVSTYSIKKRNTATKKEIIKLSNAADFVVVPSFRHHDLAFVTSVSEAPVIFDPLISKYITRVIDYGMWWKAPHKFLRDLLTFSKSKNLIWDTVSHGKYFNNIFGKRDFSTLYIGADTSEFYPIPGTPKSDDKVIVGFYGSYNPLQGIDVIIRAAKILEPESHIQFELIGHGFVYKKIRKLASQLNITNVKFIDTVPYAELNNAINKFDICLGIFGRSKKTDVVIPNKVYHYAAAHKCIITKNTEAIYEIFNDDQIKTVENSPKELAKSIKALAQDIAQRETLATNAYKLITEQYNQKKIAQMFVDLLKGIKPE